MAMLEWPEKLYVHSEECSADVNGTYVRVSGKNDSPVWKHADRVVFIYLGSVPSSESQVNLKLTRNEASIKDNKSFLCCPSPLQRGEIPQFPVRHWTKTGIRFELLFGTVMDIKPNPEIDLWAQMLFRLLKKLPNIVYVNQREDIDDEIEDLTSALAQDQWKKFRDMQTQSFELEACMKGCVAAFTPDIELKVESDHIPANSNILMAKSPVFEAMLKDGSPMKESVSGCVELPTATSETVRTLLCLLHTDGLCLDCLSLDQDRLLNVLSQAAEWQCTEVVKSLIGKAKPKIKDANHRVAVEFLKVASVQASSTQSKEWEAFATLAAKRVAETCEGDLDLLLPLSFDAVSPVLACDELDTKGSEGRVLQFVMKWMQTHGSTEHIGKLLQNVRFPFMRLTSLGQEEKVALRYLGGHAGPELQQLIGEATLLQIGHKRPREESGADKEYKKRAKKRVGNAGMPILSEQEVGLVMCGGLW